MLRAVNGRLRKTALRCPKSMQKRTGSARSVRTRSRGSPAPGNVVILCCGAVELLVVPIPALVPRAVHDRAEHAERRAREACHDRRQVVAAYEAEPSDENHGVALGGDHDAVRALARGRRSGGVLHSGARAAYRSRSSRSAAWRAPAAPRTQASRAAWAGSRRLRR